MSATVIEMILPLLASLPRMASVLLMFAMFGRRVLPGLVRAELVLVLALFLMPQAQVLQIQQLSAWSWFALIAREAAIGLTLGYFLGVVFWVAENLGYLIDLQTGASSSSIYDPMAEHADGPMSSFMLQLVTALVLAGGGLLVMLEIVFESYRVWPISASLPDIGESLPSVLGNQADRLLWLTLRFAAPFVIFLLLIDLVLGILNRFAEQIDLQAWSMPLKSMTALLVLLLFASFIHESIRSLVMFDSAIIQMLTAVFGER